MSNLKRLDMNLPLIGRGSRPRMAEQVALALAAKVLDEAIPPGTVLDAEHVMQEQFGVSRATLREALRLLEFQGLIKMRSGRSGGPVVAEMSPRGLAESSLLQFHAAGATVGNLRQARLAIEPYVARLAASGDMESESAIKLSAFAHAAVDPPHSSGHAYVYESGEFHQIIIDMADNPVLRLVCGLLAGISYNTAPETDIFSSRAQEKIAAQHVDVARAVLAGDGDQAERLMREHMTFVSEQIPRIQPGGDETRIPISLSRTKDDERLWTERVGRIRR